MLRRAGVVGDPAHHSLSPAIHRAGYAAHGLDWSYDAYTVAPADLDGFIRERLDDPSWAGLSVTAPHKEAVLAYGTLDEPTRLLGAGNTLLLGDTPTVHNTDVPGFVRAWRAHDLAAPATAAIVGNGATARSILLALAGLGLRELTVLVRNPERAADVTRLAGLLGVAVDVRLLGEDPGPVDVLANTIPAAATAPHAAAWAASARSVFDVVYDPWPTPLGEAATDTGRPALNGLDLLAGQAVDQFHLMTGAAVGFDACRSAAELELRRRAGL